MAVTINIILLFYFLISIKLDPYKSKKTSDIDSISTFTLLLTVLLILGSYTTSDAVSFIFIGLVIILNMILLFLVLRSLLIAFLIETDLTKVITTILMIFPCLSKIINISPRTMKVFILWKTLRQSLMIPENKLVTLTSLEL